MYSVIVGVACSVHIANVCIPTLHAHSINSSKILSLCHVGKCHSDLGLIGRPSNFPDVPFEN